MNYGFSFLLPWLCLIWCFQVLTRLLNIPWRGYSGLIGLGLISAAIIFWPVAGIAAGRWMAGLNLPPSIPLLGLLAGQVWKNALAVEVLRAPDRKTAWVFGAIAGTCLYPLALGLGSFDPYSSPRMMSCLFPAVAFLTLLLLWQRNRFGLLLLLSILGYDFACLESRNFWDYLVDPVYWLLSLAVLFRALVLRIRPRNLPVPQQRAWALPSAR